MKYGFIIDNRKCIGCHACTTACKSEHETPVGVNRTWVKQVEKGTFPDSRRLFSVMRCNHCADAPCVSICPTEALYTRDDGIVDFDNDRCIACKSCMQACPYDALYIDPETHTAAKCNYCAHRVDVGLEPACVNVCPEHAIISGDMDDPETEISQLLAREPVKTRKPEKGTKPQLYYIDADDVSLIPSETDRSTDSYWGSQSLGVGHFSKQAEKMSYSNADVIAAVEQMDPSFEKQKAEKPPKSIDILMNKAQQTYNTPDKGILWGWEVSGYVWTKAISTGTFLITLLGWSLGRIDMMHPLFWWTIGTGLLFLALTGILLIKDLDQPKRFAYVLLRPHWESWLVKGGYAITVFGGLLTLMALAKFFEWDLAFKVGMYVTGASAMLVAIYTAFLFAQAKGRDFWQSPTLSIHMLVHALMAGSAVLLFYQFLVDNGMQWQNYLVTALIIGILINIFTLVIELGTTHPTKDAKTVVDMILKGRYKNQFWGIVLFLGNIAPLALLIFAGTQLPIAIAAGLLVLVGIYYNNHIWVEAPQRISLV